LGRKTRRRLRPLVQELEHAHPGIDDPAERIAAGEVLVDGRFVHNPASLVPIGASIVVRPRAALRGEAKLAAALDAFRIGVRGVAVDLGAAAGGFTRVLLARGAERVYAVDAGHGQLLGSLRADARVVNLEGINLGDMRVPELVDLVTIDLSYLALADAVPQLERLRFAADADVVALVKPMFELRLAAPPARPETAVPRACAAFDPRLWWVRACMRSPARGSRGAVEFVVWATRCARSRGRAGPRPRRARSTP
jgi:23S rRNA (cytidine1920-2'-O)/16S rRNA (cytidine1409-2'-O)-methyltransferase